MGKGRLAGALLSIAKQMVNGDCKGTAGLGNSEIGCGTAQGCANGVPEGPCGGPCPPPNRPPPQPTSPPTPQGRPGPQPAPQPTPQAPPPPLGQAQFGVMNADGGIYWRSGPDWNTAEASPGNGFYPGTVIQVSCYQAGPANVPGSSNGMWEQASWVRGPGRGSGWINEHFINDGAAINHPSPGVPPCSAPPPAPQTWSETPGGVTHTWTNYANAGGSQGPSIQTSQTVQVACKVQGFRVADGDTWWYRIASSPWNGAYYASADAFYNNGQTSGSLHGTPFVDNAVADC
jgi:hypothetical protein